MTARCSKKGRLGAHIAISVLGLAGTAVRAQTVNFSPNTLSFSPAGPYSVPRDAAVGSQVAEADATATAQTLTCRTAAIPHLRRLRATSRLSNAQAPTTWGGSLYECAINLKLYFIIFPIPCFFGP